MLDIKKWIAKMSTIVLVGEIKPYAGNNEPTGWFKCDGRAISRIDYAALFDVIGTTYGAGDGSTTFNLPDMRDRFPVGAGSSYALNSTGGSNTHHHTTGNFTLGTNHIPAHTHGSKSLSGGFNPLIWGDTYGIHGIVSKNTGGTQTNNKAASNGSQFGRHDVTINATHEHSSVGGGQAHNHGNTGDSDNRPPYIGINFIIYTGVA